MTAGEAPYLPSWLMHAGIFCEACALFLFVPFAALLSRIFPPFLTVSLQHWSALFGACVAGVGNMLVVISTRTFIQRETHDENRGKVFGSLLTVMNAIGLPIILLLSHLGSLIPLSALFTWLSSFTMVMGAAGFWPCACRCANPCRPRPLPSHSLTRVRIIRYSNKAQKY